MTWLEAFVVTLAVELTVALIVVRDRPRGQVAGVVAAANAVSHPLFWFVLLRVLPGSFFVRVVIGEVVVVALEAWIYQRALELRPVRALALAATLNAASYLVGIALTGG